MNARSLIIASLLLNLLLLGMVLGHLGHGIVVTMEPNPADIAASLPDDKRLEFNAALDKAKQDTAPVRAQIDATRRNALCILLHEPFDRKAYLATVDKLHQLHGQMMHHIGAAVTAIAPKFEPRVRLAFVDLLRPAPPTHDTLPDCSTKE